MLDDRNTLLSRGNRGHCCNYVNNYHGDGMTTHGDFISAHLVCL